MRIMENQDLQFKIYLNKSEACQYLSCNIRTLNALIEENNIPVLQLGERSFRIKREDLETILLVK